MLLNTSSIRMAKCVLHGARVRGWRRGGVGWGGVESGSKGQRSWGWGVRLKVLEVGWRVVVTN